MEKMKRKKVLSVLLASTLVFGMTGCMSKGTESGGEKKKTEQKHVEAPKGALDKYSETVTISTVLPENAGIQWQEGDDYGDNPWYRAYEERLNIKVVNDG